MAKLMDISVLVLALVAAASASDSPGLRGPKSPRRLSVATWMPPKPNDQSCLKAFAGGCFMLRTRNDCLASKDGRSRVQWMGLQIQNEPCVWCGFGRCHNNNSNVCEPYDFLYHGSGIGFHTFVSQANYEVAHCDSGVALAARTATAPPTTLQASGSQDAACSAHPGCAALGLDGDCCPSPNGNLDCCGEAASRDAAPQIQSGGDLGAGPDAVSPPGALPAPALPDDSWWKTAPLKSEDTSCLMEHRFGCSVVADKRVCLGSRDGRDEVDGFKVKDQPCTWCGNGACRSGSANLCEPLNYLMEGEGKAFSTFWAKAIYQVAKCKDGEPMPAVSILRHPPLPVVPTLAPWWLTPRPTGETMSCLANFAEGCFAAKTMGQCLMSGDASSVDTIQGLKVRGEACVWCGGGPCTSNSSAVCAPFDYALRGQGTAFATFYAKTYYKVASCPKSDVAQRSLEITCLKDATAGCNTLKDAASCLSSRDGRQMSHMDGFKVHGEPCVWCGGGACTSNSNSQCEPFDWVMNGRGHAFSLNSPQAFNRVAGCKNGRAAAMTVDQYSTFIGGYMEPPLQARPLVPFWVAEKPKAEDLKCLKPTPKGCNANRDMESCMTSTDGRALKSFKGMNIAGEPCVWCGGIACTTNSTSLCEPFDYVMYGSGVAFADFVAKGVYKVANCEKGDVTLPSYDYSCLQKSSSGGCTDIWNAEDCLASKDGRSVSTVGVLQVQNQPCVWCGGGPCHSGKASLCEAFDYAANGEGRTFALFHAKGTYRLAACKNGKPKAATLNNFTDFVPGYTMRPRALPTLPPRAKWWIRDRPSEANLTCLATKPTGCSSLTDMGSCLSSRDGRSTAATADGFKIQNEPCVWCGGGRCHSNATTYCEPFDFIMRGEGKAFKTFYMPHNFQVAQCRAGIPLPKFSFGCLQSNNAGCHTFRDAGACLGSKDGRPNATVANLKVRDQPCVWCGGIPCTSNSGSLCEPYDYVMNGEGRAFNTFTGKLSYSLAGCKNNKPAAMTFDGYTPYVQGFIHPALNTPAPIVPYWVPVAPEEKEMTCLTPATGGCSELTEMKTCMSSRDGSGVQSLQGLKVQGEPCVWCGGGPCTTNSSATCLPFSYAMGGEGKAFTSFLAKAVFSVAGCYTPYKKPAYDYTCLEAAPSGCSSIRNPWDCLGRKDGRSSTMVDGLHVAGEPCVWCGGGLCHSGANTMCEPFDYVMNGAGRAFYNFHAKLTYRLAACKDGKPQGATLDGFSDFIPGAIPTVKPFWWITKPKPQGEELSCLMDHKFGCFVVKHKETCLGSKDGRSKVSWNGLKIHGEPCVWCGGFPCQTNSTNLCEPYDFLMHGEGKAFLYFNAKTSYNVARCKGGKASIPAGPEGNADALLNTDTSAQTGTLGTTGTETREINVTVPPASSNAGKDCWYECGEKSGPCDWCGSGQACCRNAWSADGAGCAGATGFTTDSYHECVKAASGGGAAASSGGSSAISGGAAASSGGSSAISGGAGAGGFGAIAGGAGWLAHGGKSSGAWSPSTLGPLVSPITTASPAISTSEASREVTVPLPEGIAVPAITTAAPGEVTIPPPGVTVAPGTQTTAIAAGSDCWFKCGEKAGDCPSFCGAGKACCRSGFLTDGPDCAGVSPMAFTDILHHQCVDKPAVSTSSVPTTISTSVPGTSASGMPVIGGVRGPATTAPRQEDARGATAFRNASDDGNVTIIGGGVPSDGGSGFPTWAWLLLGVALLVCIPLAAYYLFCNKSGKASKKKKKTRKGAVGRNEDQGNQDSFVTDASELEMQTPLVQAEERSRGTAVGAGSGGPDLFDLMDKDHDGKITQAEWNAAMGTQAPAAAPVMSMVGGPMATIPAAAVATVQPGLAAPVATMVQPGFAPPVTTMQPGLVAPVATVQPGFAMPAATVQPGMVAVSPYGARVQYAPQGQVQYRP